jgi:hypothetical protein
MGWITPADKRILQKACRGCCCCVLIFVTGLLYRIISSCASPFYGITGLIVASNGVIESPLLVRFALCLRICLNILPCFAKTWILYSATVVSSCCW